MKQSNKLQIKPPLGLIRKEIHYERVKAERFNEVCGAIARFYNAGLKIKIEWIEEYNELVGCAGDRSGDSKEQAGLSGYEIPEFANDEWLDCCEQFFGAIPKSI